MKRSQSTLLPIPVEPELKSLVKKAASRTRLSQADVMRWGLRLGVPEVVRRLERTPHPRRNFIEYMDAFTEVVKLNKERVAPSRFK